ncbi:ABC transporter permease subunit [Rubrobacter tropicus]|uniref:ABC transporter permease subunit n=2 Tax=Rubrobacter tropicus TaxID=2653851 RepID=A0A6G8QFB2_9ACTN|nr:ABC transporter permease subunit [Rubrobacter tropicus]
MILPFAWMLLGSVKDLGQLYQIPPNWIPNPFVFQNYVNAWNSVPFSTGYMNSAIVTVTVVLANLLTCSMAAYAFARIEFPFRKTLFMLFLATLMVPEQVTIIPLYIIMRNLGLIDTLFSLIIPYALFNAFGVFLLRQFIKGLPIDLEEAAIVDGANRWTIYWRIIMPLIRPALAAFGIFTFLFQWNNFFRPLIFLNSVENYTVPLAINFFRGQYTTDFALLMAGSAISIIPVLIVYIIGQRQIIEGIATTGMKQ